MGREIHIIEIYENIQIIFQKCSSHLIIDNLQVASDNPMFLPTMSLAKNMGFTAVILTFDRLPSLFKVIGNLGRVKSLAKIVIIWNNQEKAPPKG